MIDLELQGPSRPALVRKLATKGTNAERLCARVADKLSERTPRGGGYPRYHVVELNDALYPQIIPLETRNDPATR